MITRGRLSETALAVIGSVVAMWPLTTLLEGGGWLWTLVLLCVFVGLVGAGMRTNTGVSAKLFEALYDAGINIEMISTSEIRISVVTRADTVAEAARVVHSAFGLDGDEKAVVYAGTGR